MKTLRFQLIEQVKPINVVGAGQRLYFDDQPQLRTESGKSVQILAIEAYPAEVVPKSPANNTVAPQAEFKNTYLVLHRDGGEFLQYIPLSRLNIMQVQANAEPYTVFQFEFENLLNVAWQKSYIQFAAAPAAAVQSYLFGVHYKLL